MYPGDPSMPPPRAVAPKPEAPTPRELEKHEKWRFDRMVEAGYSELQALWLCLDRGVDLHKAVDLAHAAGADRAFEILN